jgi:hypothetical protein
MTYLDRAGSTIFLTGTDPFYMVFFNGRPRASDPPAKACPPRAGDSFESPLEIAGSARQIACSARCEKASGSREMRDPRVLAEHVAI